MKKNPTRRQFLGAASAFAALSVVENHPRAHAAARPNILWISTEDMSPHMGCYGDPNAITPVLDAFAKESVLYSRAFTTAGVCAPVRTAIITGMYASTIGTHHMRSGGAGTKFNIQPDRPEAVRLFPEYLRKAGYYCTNNSKEDYQFKAPDTTWDESSGKAHWRNRKPGQPFFQLDRKPVKRGPPA